MILGNFSGGLNYYKGRVPAGVGFSKEISTKAFVRIYPNPTSDLLYFEIENSCLAKETIIQIYSITGDLLVSQDFQNTSKGKLNLSKLNNGIYFLSIKTNDKSGKIEYGMRKFLKM